MSNFIKSSLSAIFFTTILFSCQPKESSKINDSTIVKENEQDGIEEAMQREITMTADPALGYIPNERLFAAKQRAALYSRTHSGLVWTERGPTNIGGRTRAILVDKNDPSGNTVFAGSVGGGIWKCTSFKTSGYSWTKVNDYMENLAVTCLAQDPSSPNIMYAGTGEGFGNSDAIRGAGIFKSTDGGNNWTRLPSTEPSASNDYTYIQDIVVTANGHVYASCRSAIYCNNGGIKKSTDQGNTWTRVIGTYNNSGSCSDALYFRGNDLEIAANGDLYFSTGLSGSNNATYGHVFKSAATLGAVQGDAGQWTEITPVPPAGEAGFRRIEIACAPSFPARVYLLCQKYNDASVTKFYRSNNGGTSWTTINVPTWCDQGTIRTDFTRGQAWYDLIAAFDPQNSSKLFIGGVDVMLSNDAGSTFTQLTKWSGSTACGSSLSTIHADIHNIAFINNSSNDVIISNDGGMYYSADGGTTFSSRNTGYNVTQYYAVAVHPNAGSNVMLAGAQDNGSHKFSSAGLGPVLTATGGDGAFCFIDQQDPNIQITSYVYSNYYISRNGGASFNQFVSNSNGDFINPSEYDSKSKMLYCNNGLGVLGRVKNIVTGTPAIETFSIPLISSQYISTLKVDPNTDNRLYIGAYSGAPKVIRVDNANGTTPVYTNLSTIGTAGYISSIDVEDGNPNHLLATLSNYGIVSVYESTDGGVNWTNIEGNLPDMPVRWGIFVPGNNLRIALATELGVWTTTSAIGTTPIWEPDNNGLAHVRTDMIRYRKSDSTITVATHGRGVFSTNLTTLPVTLFSFKGQIQDKYALLEWKTASESNTRQFEIEKSYDGTSFKKIGVVNAAGNSNTLKAYNYTDKEGLSAKNYYRLRMVDKDGTSAYSKVVLIKGELSLPQIAVLTNPFINYLDVKLTNVSRGNVDFTLTDMNGRLITVMKKIYTGEQVVRFPITTKNTLSGGTYVLTVQYDGQKISKQVLKN